MRVCLRSTNAAFEDMEIHVDAKEVEVLKLVDIVEVNEERFTPFELIYETQERKFILWVDKE